MRLGALQGLQGHHARGELRADRNPACAPVGQKFGRHPPGGGCAGPVLHQVARQHLRHHQRRLGLFAAGVQAAREQQAGDRRGREAVHVRPADRQLRRIHLLRRPGARKPARPGPSPEPWQQPATRAPPQSRRRAQPQGKPGRTPHPGRGAGRRNLRGPAAGAG